MRILVLLALVGASVVGWSASPAQASPLCDHVSTDGTVIGDNYYGACVPYQLGTICDYENFGADPQANFHLGACVPAPVDVLPHG